MAKFFFLFTICFLFIAVNKLSSQQEENYLEELIRKTNISGLWYLGYNYESLNKTNSFTFKRGYLTIKHELSDMLSVRFTQDITLDKEGGDAGNVEMRLKYLLLKIKLNQIKFLEDTYFEVGLVHRPWLAYEEHINRYRVQGTMFIERIGILNSADFGIVYAGLLGGEIDEEYQRKVSPYYPGKWGSFAVGVFNGGGYHAIENNKNKTLEGRLSLRPLNMFIPGLQLGYGFVFGKGNIPESPDFEKNLLFASFESQFGVLTGQYYTGRGNSSGSMIDTLTNNALNNYGYSIFGEYYIPYTDLSLFSRYDSFLPGESEENKVNRFIGGISYNFFRNNKVLFDAENFKGPDSDFWVYEVALEITFK